ncbi:MAG: PKD domain-containing protein [Flavobacteriales bacterium]|nr:PKD domain-containing protein [Flavobacteriales bacterium]
MDGHSILLTDQSIHQLTDVHYYWIYGDGIVDHLGTGTHTYADTGTYQVCLSVSGVNGTDTCAGMHCETVLIMGGTSSNNGFALGPVPFSGVVYLYGVESVATVTLFDAEGSVVWQDTPTAEAGRLRIEPMHLAPGAYSGLLTTAAREKRFRLVKAQR